MAVASNGAVRDDDTNPLDSVESINDLLGNTDSGDDDEASPKADDKPEYVAKSDFDSLKSTIDKLNEKLDESAMELQFLRGRASAPAQERREETKEPEPAKFEPDYDAVAKDIEARGPVALREFTEKLIEHKLGEFEAKVNQKTQQQFTARDQGQRKASMFQKEVDDLGNEYEEFWDDESFKQEADYEAAKILSLRTGMPVEEITSLPLNRTFHLYQPGDLTAAAAKIYAKRVREGKIKPDAEGETEQPANNLSLRETVRRVPRTDDLGNGNNGGKRAAPKTIDELFTNDRDRRTARAVLAKQKSYGVTEAQYVASLLRARQEHDDYVG